MSDTSVNSPFLGNAGDMSATLVRLTNEGPTDFVQGYAAQRYVVHPGKSVIVPYPAVVLWLGDPKAIDSPDRPNRTNELARLRTRYGAYDDNDIWENNRPRVVARTLDDEFIATVISDPMGTSVTPADIVVADRDNLKLQVDSLQRQMAALLDQMTRVADADVEAETVPRDTPSPMSTQPFPTSAPVGAEGGDIPGTGTASTGSESPQFFNAPDVPTDE